MLSPPSKKVAPLPGTGGASGGSPVSEARQPPLGRMLSAITGDDAAAEPEPELVPGSPERIATPVPTLLNRAEVKRARQQQRAEAAERRPSSQQLGRAAKPNTPLISELRHSHPWTFRARRMAYQMEVEDRSSMARFVACSCVFAPSSDERPTSPPHITSTALFPPTLTQLSTCISPVLPIAHLSARPRDNPLPSPLLCAGRRSQVAMESVENRVYALLLSVVLLLSLSVVLFLASGIFSGDE